VTGAGTRTGVIRSTLSSLTIDGVGDCAGRTYDYHVRHPVLGRLMIWEGLTFGEAMAAEHAAMVNAGLVRRPGSSVRERGEEVPN
jgi:hypothetical protein